MATIFDLYAANFRIFLLPKTIVKMYASLGHIFFLCNDVPHGMLLKTTLILKKSK